MGHLRDSRTVSLEEHLAIFLFTIGHSRRNHVMQNLFPHSGKIFNRYFNLTLDAITIHISQHGLDLKIKSIFAIEREDCNRMLSKYTGVFSAILWVQYHLKEWSTMQAPITEHELFNLRHAKLRNIVERTFTVLKQRFALLQIPPRHPIKTQVKIVMACCVVHNFIRQ
ncbi:putative nuclease HARBI1 [Cinnamomum micranthum f. kanehirae]|uniref:Putative nuclease HARBI1 n=1 Tax=Cinnamomum micranthum f. kanehirae TaxID=337451 RepID=A0A443NY51_9MAGN|nr:putative nuclease HARBI1 [Cinnamomum micranthum f. kanehirae]